jgi:aromatic-amino-acid transaminase
MSSLFGPIEHFAGDPILSLNDEFQVDPRTNKVNLSIGAYLIATGRVYIAGLPDQVTAPTAASMVTELRAARSVHAS